MRSLLRCLRFALLALACVSAAEPLWAKGKPPESRASEGAERIVRPQRFQSRSLIAPPLGFESWAGELSPRERRALRRHLSGLPESRQREFFTRWEHMTYAERSELAAQLHARAPLRAERGLPPRLRTPEMRQRIGEMSPAERARFFDRVREWRRLDPTTRERLRGRLAAFGALSDAEQRALVDAKFAHEDEAARAHILQQLRKASAQMKANAARRAQPEPPAPNAPGDAAPPPGEDAGPH